MDLNFVENNRENIVELNKKVAEAISNLNIDTSGPLKIAKCIRITGEINKAIKSVKTLASAIANVEPGEKAGVILSVTLQTLNSEDVKSVLSDEQRKQLEEFCQDTETVDTVVSLVDWVADEALEALDTNKDGVVTEQELEDGCVGGCLCVNRCGQGSRGCGCYQPNGCCACCPGFVTKIASCWSAFFINILCCKCGKKSVKYEDKPVATSEVNVTV